MTAHRGIPVTTPAQTIFDVAPSLSESQLERAINEADKLDLAHPWDLRDAAEGRPGAGAKRVRDLLDRHTFVLTDSELERLFVPLAVAAGLSVPQTQAEVNGFVVDFFFHLLAGLTPVRFTHAQVKKDPDHVVRVLRELR